MATTNAVKIGDKIIANMPYDSFYKKAKGVVTAIKNGWVSFQATEVMSKWDKTFEAHPTSCATSAKYADVVVI